METIIEILSYTFYNVLPWFGWVLLAWVVLSLGWKKYKTKKEYANQFKTEELPETEYCFKDAFGNKYYTFKDPKKLPAQRLLAAELALKQAELNITPSGLAEWIGTTLECLQGNRVQEAIRNIALMQERFNHLGEEKTLLAVSNVYFLIEGEDPLVMSEEIRQKKMDAWSRDLNARAFFLTFAFRTMNAVSDTSDTDILGYLTEVKAKIQGQPS